MTPATTVGIERPHAAAGAGMELVESLLTEPRLSAVAACDASGVLVRAQQPSDAACTPSLICYARGVDRWTPRWMVRGAEIATVTADGFAYAYRSGRHHMVALRTARATAHRPLVQTTGRITAIAAHPQGHAVACLEVHGSAAGWHPDGLLAGSDAIWGSTPETTVSQAGRIGGRWRVWLAPTDGTGPACVLPLELPEGSRPTGELARTASGTLLVGVFHHRPDGMRRFGLLVVDGESGRTGSVMAEHMDICYPVPAPDGHAVAYLGTALPDGDEPPSQYPCVVDGATLALRVLETPHGTWQQPVGWSGLSKLVCTAEDGPRRRLYVHDLVADTWQDVLLGRRSVQSARVHGASAAVITSAPNQPPSLDLVDLAFGAGIPLESTDLAPLPGRMRYLPQRVAGVTGYLASWLCRPEDEPVRGTIVFLHGGPFKNWSDWSWRWNPWPFVAEGFAVALVEPPMSLGYPQAVPDGWRRWRTGIAVAAVDQVRQLRAAHGLEHTPLALMGGSFGGYLALACARGLEPNLVMTHAAPLNLAQVAAASDVDWQWIREYGDPETRRADYDLQSLPAHPVPAGTRVLLSHGLDDELVPSSEALRMHRSLLRDGVSSEIAFFRSEPHGLTRPRNVRAWYRWALAACHAELSGENGRNP